jgi:serine/threonine protein kinase/class 3 adenylate cyclase
MGDHASTAGDPTGPNARPPAHDETLAAGRPARPDPGPALSNPVEGEATAHTPPPRQPRRPTDPDLTFLAPPLESDEIGRLGPYRILKVLGAGGMGMVFQAEDPNLRRLVALKVMRPELASSLTARQRFLREARATAAIEHDHIVNIFQVDQDGDVPFLAMQLLRGETLEDRLRRDGTLPLAEVLRIGRETARGLAAAHARGLVHRDIKPSNIWLEAEGGRVKILDFGLARAVGPEANLTVSGMVMGTPAYMSPEQALAQPLDARSDLFSLGCVLYRLCTGRTPFAGTHGLAHLVAENLDRLEPPQQINPEVPSALNDLIRRLLARAPADRPSSARAVAEALEHIEHPEVADPQVATGLQPVVLPPLRRKGEPTLPNRPLGPRPAPTTSGGTAEGETYLSQLRLFLEELACDFCRFEHVVQDGLAPESISIDREYDLGVPGAYADIRVAVPGRPPYFVEVKYGYTEPRLLESFRRKYGRPTPALAEAAKVVLVVDCERREDWPRFEAELAQCLPPHLGLEVWGEARLTALLRERFGLEIEKITEGQLLEARQAVDRAKGFHAFGGTDFAGYDNDPQRSQLLWHFGFWRLRQLREAYRLTPREVLPPGVYRAVAVLSADLCAFADYVRDTRDEAVIRDCLTAFYSKARYQIINRGGMIYLFLEDEVLALFGIPDLRPHYLEDALDTARALRSIGRSVSNHWQRHIDRVQPAGGLHIGMALGDLQVVSLRPFSRTHLGALGEPIKVARRLLASAGPDEIAVSNAFYQNLPEQVRGDFQEMVVPEEHGGRIKAWKLGSNSPGTSRD